LTHWYDNRGNDPLIGQQRYWTNDRTSEVLTHW
jgi:hypothetical protein